MEKNVKMRLFASVLLSIVIIVSAYAGEGTEEYGEQEVFMYKNEEVDNPTTVFSPSDKIFIHIIFSELKGYYILDTQWYDPLGKLQETTSHTFTVDEESSSYGVWAWLALRKQGRLDRFFSGTEYSNEFYGRWSVEAHLNGERIVTKYFEVVK